MSALIHLVRHGEPAAAWGGPEADPGLSARGREQAQAAARTLNGLGPLLALSSPLRRCRETAAAFVDDAAIEPAVAEVPTPDGVTDRRAWLTDFMGGRWSDASSLLAWRGALIARLIGIRAPSVIFTHFVAINAAVGAARDDARVLQFQPDHCSVTTLETDGSRLRLVRVGDEMASAKAL